MVHKIYNLKTHIKSKDFCYFVPSLVKASLLEYGTLLVFLLSLSNEVVDVVVAVVVNVLLYTSD